MSLPFCGEFDTTILRQTDVLSVLSVICTAGSGVNSLGKVSLAQTIKPIFRKIGIIVDLITKREIGTCTLIAKNLVVTARHAIEEISIPNLMVIFGSVRFEGNTFSAGSANLDYVVEEDFKCDYAVVKLRELLGEELGYVELNCKDKILSAPALLHYPLGNGLKVSVHAIEQTNYLENYLKTYHDTDYLSSGGAYFDQFGRFTAIHLGAEFEGDKVNVSRYAIELKEIVRSNPKSIFAKLESGVLAQNVSYFSSAPRNYLHRSLHNFLIDEEGRKSKLVLTGLLKAKLKTDSKISKTDGSIKFSNENLKYIKDTYPNEFKKMLKECLMVIGPHKLTKQYSVSGEIESDHTLPYYVWANTTNNSMSCHVNDGTGSGARKGEGDMPAITIPYLAHSHLRTSNSSKESVQFRKDLVELCNAGKIAEALIKCFKEYGANGIELTKQQVEKALKGYVDMKVITEEQKNGVLNKVFEK